MNLLIETLPLLLRLAFLDIDGKQNPLNRAARPYLEIDSLNKPVLV